MSLPENYSYFILKLVWNHVFFLKINLFCLKLNFESFYYINIKNNFLKIKNIILIYFLIKKQPLTHFQPNNTLISCLFTC